MPFKSEEQRRYLWANEPEIARDWSDRYGATNGGIMDMASNGNLRHDFANFTNGNNINVPTSFQARPQSQPVDLAYVTPQEQGILQTLKPGTPHEGPMGIPNYDSFDAAGGYSNPDTGYSASSGGGGGGWQDSSAQDAEINRMRATTVPKPEQQPNFLSNLGTSIKNFNPMEAYNKYGIIPNAFRFGKKLFTPPTEAQKVQANINKGYDVMNPAEMHGLATRRPAVLPSGGGDGQQQYPPWWYDNAYAQNIVDDEELDIDTSTGDMEEWIQRFRVKDPYRQDQGALDEQIKEYVSKLYT